MRIWLKGEVIGEFGDGGDALLPFRLNVPRLAPEREYDLDLEVPMYVYERLGLATNRAWTISIRSDALHLLPAEPLDDPSAKAATFAPEPDEILEARRPGR